MDIDWFRWETTDGPTATGSSATVPTSTYSTATTGFADTTSNDLHLRLGVCRFTESTSTKYWFIFEEGGYIWWDGAYGPLSLLLLGVTFRCRKIEDRARAAVRKLWRMLRR